jgi:hypothetical protein
LIFDLRFSIVSAGSLVTAIENRKSKIKSVLYVIVGLGFWICRNLVRAVLPDPKSKIANQKSKNSSSRCGREASIKVPRQSQPSTPAEGKH